MNVFGPSPKRASAVGLVVGLLVASFASAQGGPFGGGMGPGSAGPPPQQQQQPSPKKPPPGTPELHAASGGGDSTLPEGREPSLPERPLAISDKLRLQLGSDMRLDEPELGRAEATDRDFYGLYYQEHSGDYQLKLAFPLWFERTQPSLTDPTKTDRASMYGSIYYNRRSAEHADDVVFPVFWNLRSPGRRTTVVGPLVNRIAPNETDNWLAPLYFLGTREKGSYQIVPPLLSYFNHDDEGGFNLLLGLGFCSFSGADGCFNTPEERDRGIAPFYFDGYDEHSRYRLIPPLLHYHEEDDRALSELDVVGPYYRETYHKKNNVTRDLLHVMPFYWSIWGKDERHTTLFPFFHYGWHKNEDLFVNPLYLTSTGEEGEKTFVTWGYARYRGRTELDMITPLLWLYRDEDAGIDQQFLFPFYYRRTGPRENSIAVFPFYGSFHRHGISDSTWVTPFFQHTHDLTGWSTNLYPIAFFGRDRHESHSVLAPIFYDFAGPSSRSTVAFPLYWRFAQPDSLTQLVGNFLYTEQDVPGGTDWALRVLPLFGYGERPDGHWWNILFGMMGYERRGATTEASVFWVPITLSGGDDE